MEHQNPEENKEIPKTFETGAGKSVSFVKRGLTPVTGMEDIVEEFHKYYMENRHAGRTDLMQIFREFRTDLKLNRKIWFNPQGILIKGWMNKWENSLPIHARKVQIKIRDVKKNQSDEKDTLKKIEYHELEDGAKNLQSLLLEDASQLMEESNEAFEVGNGYWKKEDWEKIRIKKKALALGIAKEILSGVQKHQVIQIKKNKEGRETVNFMMDIMKQASAGELTEQELALLDSSIPK